MASGYRLDLGTENISTGQRVGHRKEIIAEVAVNNIPSFTTDNSESDSIEDRLKDEDFKTPQEYYSNLEGIVTTDKTQQGFHAISNSGDSSERKWFWSEDLKNWCSYRVSMNEYECSNSFQLQVWNGKTGWMDISYWNDFYINSDQDKYGIRKYQHKIIDTLVYGTHDESLWHNRLNHKNTLEIMRGWCAAVGVMGPLEHEFFYNQGHLLDVLGFKLQKSTRYSINMPGTFQTIRWSTVPGNTEYENTNFARLFGQTNAVFFVPTGSPTVWRLPTGELFLATTLNIKADNGEPYIYKMDKKAGGFKKIYSPILFYGRHKHVKEYRMMGDNDQAAANWINKICASFFGDGNDKTIDKDWLRQDSELITEIQNAEQSQTGQYDMLDTNKIYEQNNINKENSLQCKFVVNRPVVTSEEITDSDYVKQW